MNAVLRTFSIAFVVWRSPMGWQILLVSSLHNATRAWLTPPSHSRDLIRLAIPENGLPRDGAHDEQTCCDGALPLEPSKSEAIKINLIGITRPIHIYPVI